MTESSVLKHGGRLQEAVTRYGIPLSDWLDLSTGINPNGWPVPTVPATAWACLPEDDDGLVEAAREYYETENILPVAGSQAAIQALPILRSSCRVSVIHPGYAEHAHAWRRNGHTVNLLNEEEIDDAISETDVLVLIRPNNPTGECFSSEQILCWHTQLTARGGWLIADEAFMDFMPEQSLVKYCPRPGLIVLRSLGKFFGLAGARVGFVCGPPESLIQLNNVLGPWAINTPARWVARAALKDKTWQGAARRYLVEQSENLRSILSRHGLTPNGGCVLFQWVRTPYAGQLYDELARQGILTRLFNDPTSLRFGLPGNENGGERLNMALSDTVQRFNLSEVVA